MNTLSKTIEFGRFSIFCRAYGDRDPLLLCVNGAQQTTASWRSVIKALTRDFTVVTFDFPGQGRSRFVDERAALSFEEQVGIVSRVAAETARGPCAVFGASWGSLIAAGYAARHPDRVTRLILAGFALRPTPLLKFMIRHGQELCREANSALLASLIVDHIGQSLPAAMKSMIEAQFQSIEPAKVAAFVEHSRLVDAIGDLREVIDLGLIGAETLVINGEHDGLVDPADAALARRAIPRCLTVTVPGAGHFLHLEKPAVLEDYRRFLTAPWPRRPAEMHVAILGGGPPASISPAC